MTRYPATGPNEEAASIADSMHSTEELLAGLAHSDPNVRSRVVPRLVARTQHDERTVGALIASLQVDESAEVRSSVAMNLWRFAEDGRVEDALRQAAADPDDSVRWAVGYSLSQMGISPESLGLPLEWE